MAEHDDSQNQSIQAQASTTSASVGAATGSAPATPARRSAAKQTQAKSKAPAAAAKEFNLDSPEWYLNRELTWLEFNRRVLHEGQDSSTPLLERIKFLAIVSSNIDEFFMKRIGGLKQQVGAGVQERSVDGRSPEEQIAECHAVVRDLKEQQRTLAVELHKLLITEGIRIGRLKTLEKSDQAYIQDYYTKYIYPLITPLAMDPAHPFPFISNLSLNLLVTVRYPDESHASLARIKVPIGSGIPRFLQVRDKTLYVPLEDVIGNHLEMLFPGMIVESCQLFRVTRNAMTERSEERASDLLELIESELRDRKFAPIVRLEVSKGMDPLHRGMLAAELGLDEAADVFEVDGLMGKRDLFQIVGIDRPELHDAPHHALDHPKLAGTPNIFHAIRENGPILLQHPYESFITSVERFLREASQDPKVMAIKMTLYRTAEHSKIIQYLIDAAQLGKQVAVAVELKARFDESANIRWATHLEEAGIHVSYGVMGLKTHSKVIFVIRRDYDGLRRYAHFGTGNYHSGTARLYSDLGMLTCDPVLGADLTEFFNYLTTGHVAKRNYKKLLPAPKHLKPGLLERIDREIKMHSADSPGLIQFKMNALEDKDIARALYQASQGGVKVELVVRDTCRIRPGIPGLSDNISVVSVVGRFLEHCRIFHFRNGGADEYFIGSADAMMRNLESRVETVVPVEHPELRDKLQEFLDVQLSDQRRAWDMKSDGTYVQRTPTTEKEKRGSQDTFILLAEKRQKLAAQHKKRKSKVRSVARRKAK